MKEPKGIPFFNNVDDALVYMEQKHLNKPLTEKDVKFYEALLTSFKIFIEEERKGQRFSSAERLMAAIQAARALYQ